MNIHKAIDYFQQSLKNDQASANTLKAYQQDLTQFCKIIPKEELDDLKYDDFFTYLSQLSALNLKISTIRRKRLVVYRFLNFCYRKHFCENRLYEYIDPIHHKKNTAPKEVFSTEEIATMQAYLKNEKEQITETTSYKGYYPIRNQLLFSLLLYTGCRAHEAVSLKKKDIDKSKGTIILLTKGDKYNVIPIHDKLMEALEQYEKDISYLQGEIKVWLEKSIYLFPSKNDASTYMATRTLHDLMKKLSAVIDRPIHAHLFRHTFASYCIAANMDISTVSALISHSNPSITLSIYTHEINAHNKQEQIKKLRFD